MNLGIDLGTSRVVICSATAGILLDEPTVIAVSRDNGKVIACGSEAESMLGRTPPSIQAVRPVRNGVIVEYDLAEKMLRCFLRRVCSNKIAKPCAAVSIAETVTEVERRSFIEAVISAGARRVTVVPETVAAAIGTGIDVTKPLGQMVVNIGGGTVDASVLTLKGEAVSLSVRTAGIAADEAIVRYLRSKYGMVIGDGVAEQIKIKVGGALPRKDALTMEAKGRDLLTGLPRVQTVSSDEICEALQETVDVMTETTQKVLEITPPELAGDIIREGIWLTGGMAQLYGLPERIAHITGVECRVAENPTQCVAIGACRALQYTSSFSEVFDLGNFSYRLSDAVTN